jgi:hypothetical protein
VTLTLTFCSLSIPVSQFSKTWWHKAILRAKAAADCQIPELMNLVSHVTEMQQCRKSIWSDKAIALIVKPLKMVVLVMLVMMSL